MDNLQTKISFVEADARERAKQLLDSDSFHEFLGPFDRFTSPHLEKQGIVPQSDDGVIVAKGTIDREPSVVISIESAFQGGGIGEISGAKIAAALELTLKDNKNNIKTHPVIILDTGGVRLQEANYGLLAIAEIQTAVIELRSYVPVIGVIPGKIGSFGGMSITAGLFSTLIMTAEGRLGLNGPEVIEQEAGITELDSRNRPLIWGSIGGYQRVATSLADVLVEDDCAQITAAVQKALTEVPSKPKAEQIERFRIILNYLNPNEYISPSYFRELTSSSHSLLETKGQKPNPKIRNRAQQWFYALTSLKPKTKVTPTVWSGDTKLGSDMARFISIGPDPEHRFPRVREGEVGLEEGWAVAHSVSEVVKADEENEVRRPIIALVDVPSQAYGYVEELSGLHQACAAAVNAYAKARLAGHPVISLLVGKAISGAFLTHGLQANRLIALNDEKVNVHVMSKGSAARITRRSIEELEQITENIPAMAYDIQSFQTLGALHEVIGKVDADNPTEENIKLIRQKLKDTIANIRTKGDTDLRIRLDSSLARRGRAASHQVRDMMQKQWYV
ncbi:biotin-independent malonate decarboxylase subunit beta [Salicibibacter cibi]|uniref:Biotin-independent malonate decarboxylase subunit beta n=1 Tax=Salicibibacter cibi TaxID=2743001 RepID=A0A7T6Z9D5_9BACI|nr:biotin-independent malonate decarboxylase subunit beta [Salicibibacter cibi]QQK79348.1 biotin-independent malonate decarboxylase subunit beta [Salicibibacter cibi]